MYIYDNISLNFSYREICFRKICTENNQKTHFMFSKPPPPENRTVCNMEEYGGPGRPHTHDNTIRCTRTACCITKTTDTHSEYVILVAPPRQQRFRARASMLRLHIQYLSSSSSSSTLPPFLMSFFLYLCLFRRIKSCVIPSRRK